MAHLEVLAQGIQRQQRTDPARQQVGQELEARQVADRFEIAHVLAEKALQALLLPAPQRAVGLRQERLGEAAEAQERRDQAGISARRDLQLLSGLGQRVPRRQRLGAGEWMETVVVVASLQGISAATIDVQARAAGDEEAEPVAMLVELALEPALPAAPLVQLVEHHQRLRARPACGANLGAVGTVVPAQVEARLPASGQPPGQGGLADLPGSCQQHHLFRQVARDGSLVVTLALHELILLESKICCNILCVKAQTSWSDYWAARAGCAPAPPARGGPSSRPPVALLLSRGDLWRDTC